MPARLRPLLGEWGRKLPHTIPCKISQFQQFIVQPIADYLREIFIRLLLHSEERGPHTSGLAGLKIDDTLKLGYWNHQRFCAQARSIEPTVVWGRLYHLHAGFPAVEVPEGLILTRGTVDPLADGRRQQEIDTPRFGRPTGDWDLIHGELVTFTDSLRDLPPIDRLEGFRPGGHSMYQRVLAV